MPTELEELVEFLHHGNTQIRQIACEHLVGYSSSNAAIFKKHQLGPITDLKLLVRDYAPIAKNALTILINLSSSQDEEVVKTLADDDAFLTTLLKKLLDLFVSGGSPSPSTSTSSTSKASDTDRDTDPDAHFDYLSYLLANLSAAHASIRTFLVTRQAYDGVVPLSKLVVFTTHPSLIRRRGVASTLKNVNIVPYLLLPLAGNEEYSAEETEGMLVELQLLPADKQREADEGRGQGGVAAERCVSDYQDVA
ncbi:hypothetical protein DV736_g2614, partial [Chaetothyriales sp. CBS 134916]